MYVYVYIYIYIHCSKYLGAHSPSIVIGLDLSGNKMQSI